jgi:hypothetical protein
MLAAMVALEDLMLLWAELYYESIQGRDKKTHEETRKGVEVDPLGGDGRRGEG